MTNLKKKINKLKTENFLNQFPILMLVQRNNLSIAEWSEFKQKIQQNSKNSKFQILNVKNSILKKSLLTNHLIINAGSSNTKSLESNSINKKLSNRYSLETLCQGPNFLIGCHNLDQLESLWNCLHSNSKCIFICCFYKNQLLNHLDVDILLKANSSIYYTLLSSLDKKMELYHLLQSKLQLHPLLNVQSNLIMTFYALQQLKKQQANLD